MLRLGNEYDVAHVPVLLMCNQISYIIRNTPAE